MKNNKTPNSIEIQYEVIIKKQELNHGGSNKVPPLGQQKNQSESSRGIKSRSSLDGLM